MFSFVNCTQKGLTLFSKYPQSEEHKHLDGVIQSGIEEGLRVIYAFGLSMCFICAYC